MKTALDNHVLGKQKEVNADDFGYVIRDKDRFICPECLEPVSMVDGKYQYFFKHRKKTEQSIECDRRIESNASQSIYQRIGIPLFLRKNNDESYSIHIGFRALPQHIISICKSMNSYIEINDSYRFKRKYFINDYNFKDNATTYLQIDDIPNSTLKINYSDTKTSTLLSPYWSNYIESSFFSRGALFMNNNDGGKIIRTGDCVSTYKPYLLVRPKRNRYYEELDNYNGLKYKKVANLSISNHAYEIIEIQFMVHSSSSLLFKNISNFLHGKYGLFLIDCDTSITPIWPPCSKTESGYTPVHGKSLYYIVNSNNDEPSIFTYIGNNSTPSISYPIKVENAWFSKLNVSDYGSLINIDRRIVSNGIFISNRFQNLRFPSTYLNDICLCEKGNFKRLSDIKLQIKCESEVYLIDIKLNLKKLIFKNGNIELENDEKVQFVIISCRRNVVAIYQKEVPININSTIDELCLLKSIKKNTSTSSVKVTPYLYNKIKNLDVKDLELKMYLIGYIRNNKIPLVIMKEIERL